jgi:hypothetical protein
MTSDLGQKIRNLKPQIGIQSKSRIQELKPPKFHSEFWSFLLKHEI